MKTIRRTVSEARIESETPGRLVISSGIFGKLAILAVVGLLVLLAIVNGLTWWFQKEGPLLAIGTSVTCLVPALILMLAVASSVQLTLDAQQRALTLTSHYLLGIGRWPRRREHTINFSQITRAECQPAVYTAGYRSLGNNVQVETDDGLCITLQFGPRQEQAVKTVGKIRDLLGSQAPPTVQSAEAAQVAAVAGTYSAMLREIRSWGFWMLGLGALHVFISGLFSASWGILLIVVGLASFYFRDAAMFVVYAVTLAWAGLSNLLSAAGGWQVFALFQFFLVYAVIQQFRRFRRAQIEQALRLQVEHQDQADPPDRGVRVFPWAGLVLGSFSLTALVLVLLGVFILMATAMHTPLPGWLSFIEGLSTDGAVLGFAVSLGALLSGCQRKGVAVAGCVLSAMTLLIELGLAIIGRL